MAYPSFLVPADTCSSIEKETTLDSEFAWYGPYFGADTYYEVRYIMSKLGPYKAKAYGMEEILSLLPETIHNSEYDFDYKFVIKHTRGGYLATYENEVWVAEHMDMLRAKGMDESSITILKQWRKYFPHRYGKPTIPGAIGDLFVTLVRSSDELKTYRKEK